MQGRRILMLTAALAALQLGACQRAAEQPRAAGGSNDTSVLGAYGEPPGPDTLIDVDGRKVSPPPAPRNTMAQLAAVGRTTTLALWTEDGRVMASRHDPTRGWNAPQPLEEIAGEATDVQLAANGRGAAMALWRHTVGRIDSLRYSRYETRAGWSEPDVLPGALPRARQPGKTAGRPVQEAAPRLQLDANGNARAEWLSGFNEDEVQVSTYVPGEGWARPVDLPVAAAQPPAAGR